METVPIAFIQQCYLTCLVDEIENWKDLSRPYGDVSHALTNKNISSTTISIEYKTHNSDITYAMYRINSKKIENLELLSPQNATSFRRLQIYASGVHDYLFDDVQVVKSTWDASDFRQKLKSARLYPIVDVMVAAPDYGVDCDTRILDTLKEVGVIITGRLYYRHTVSSFQEAQLSNLLRSDSLHSITLRWNSITGTGWAGISLAFFESFTVKYFYLDGFDSDINVEPFVDLLGNLLQTWSTCNAISRSDKHFWFLCPPNVSDRQLLGSQAQLSSKLENGKIWHFANFADNSTRIAKWNYAVKGRALGQWDGIKLSHVWAVFC